MPSAHGVPCTSVVKPPHEPVPPRRIVTNSIHAAPRPCVCIFLLQTAGNAKINRQVPFVLIPAVFLPPLARTAPRSRRRHHISLHSAEVNAHWPLVAYFHARRHRRPDHTKSRCHWARFTRLGFVT